MATWLHERGIGEARAALVEGGRIVEMLIEPDGPGPRAGAILEARLARATDATGRARVSFAGGEADLVGPLPAGASIGMALRVAIEREALPERGTVKLPRARLAPAEAETGEGPDLRARIESTGHPVREPAFGEDALEALGWSELLEEAASLVVARPEALLRISLTPAMTLIDVDGAGPASALAMAGARASGQAIRLFGIAGSIGIDLPTVPDKAGRQAAAAALDAVLPPPFERTAVNGFGFLQIVRRRTRRSLPELIAADPAGAAARALLRRGERATGRGGLTLAAAPLVIAAIEAQPAWSEALAQRIGAPVRLRPEPGLPISAGHAQRDHA